MQDKCESTTLPTTLGAFDLCTRGWAYQQQVSEILLDSSYTEAKSQVHEYRSNYRFLHAAMLKLFAAWQIKNQNTAKYFAAAIACLIAHFVIVHWVRIAFNRICSRPSAFRKAVISITRPIQRAFSIKTIAGFSFRPGTTILVLVYLGINAGLTFYDRPDKAPMLTILAKRLGWMALCNLCLVVFLGLKNTPLSPLAGHSFDSINVLHRCVGYTTVLYLVLHAAIYMAGLAAHDALTEVMLESEQIAGAIAGVAMILIFFTAIGVVRRRQYEVFYIVHIVMVAVILISVGLHRPELSLKALIITLVAAGLWFLDKSFRITRWAYFFIGNHCVLEPLPNQATRVTFHRHMRGAPGSSAFLWIPGVRLLEKHPFTLVSTEPATFIVKAKDGFTRALHDAACKRPGGRFRASVEGPYGQAPDPHNYDKIVLFAGGSGITYTLGVALGWAGIRRTPRDFSSLEFIWTVKHRATLSWFESELAQLRSNPRINVSIHITSETFTHGYADTVSPYGPYLSDCESAKTASKEAHPVLSTRSSNSALSEVEIGRPNVEAIVARSIAGLTTADRVCVAACGPVGLLNNVRRTVKECLVSDAPSITTFAESYSF
ncbi:Ferric reductase transmembrane component 3 [Lecanosticta acicola]|uniref:Ferric reductase transmembrane component 3 n=1 Tax=Lecanosticta acicola TaxID=111012 RepID=A0AAI8YR80_9PEZI|nr:Ferric reductase transmembrane component 3 [Lecanosticta acicola]